MFIDIAFRLAVCAMLHLIKLNFVSRLPQSLALIKGKGGNSYFKHKIIVI